MIKDQILENKGEGFLPPTFNGSNEAKDPIKRRNWTVEAKTQVIKDIDVMDKNQELIGSYLRRNGIYRSTVSLWRKQYQEGTLVGGKRGRLPKYTEDQKQVQKLSKEIEKLKNQLEISEKINDLQKKIYQMINNQELIIK
jgi:transposase-like protein